MGSKKLVDLGEWLEAHFLLSHRPLVQSGADCYRPLCHVPGDGGRVGLRGEARMPQV
jgi:hypothetical protein